FGCNGGGRRLGGSNRARGGGRSGRRGNRRGGGLMRCVCRRGRKFRVIQQRAFEQGVGLGQDGRRGGCRSGDGGRGDGRRVFGLDPVGPDHKFVARGQ